MSWKELLRRVVGEAASDNLLDYAGSVAFSTILSIFPFLLFAVTLASLLIDPRTLASLVEAIHRAVPKEVADILTQRLHALTSTASAGLATVGAVLALWSASGAVAALVTAFDAVYDVHESRPFWKTRGLAVLMTIGAAAFVVALAALVIAAPAVTDHLGHTVGTLIVWLRWPVIAILMLFVIACLYYFLPNVDQPFHLVTAGSVTAVALWVIASLGFSYYASHFGNFELVYGTLGGAIVLLLWLYLSAAVILLGAEIDAVLARSS